MARNPDRIPIVLAAVATAWMKHPDLRLGQLIVNATLGDPFYVEDDALVEKLLAKDKEMKA